jgi:hypothetical protein
MPPQTAPPHSTHQQASDHDSLKRIDSPRHEHTAPSVPDLLSIGGLLVVYIIALTALGLRRAVLWPLSSVSDRRS